MIYERCGFSRRALASSIDGIVYFIATIALVFLMILILVYLRPELRDQISASLKSTKDLKNFQVPGIAVLISFIFSSPIVVQLFFEAFTGRTVGKLITGMVVANSDGTRLNRSAGLWRALFKSSPILCAYFGAISHSSFMLATSGALNIILQFGCFLALTSERQALHDTLSGTAVYIASEVQRTEPTVKSSRGRVESPGASYETW